MDDDSSQPVNLSNDNTKPDVNPQINQRTQSGPAVIGDLGARSETKQTKQNPTNEPLAKNRQKKRRSWPSLLFLLIVISALSLAFWYRQDLIDWYALRNYTPSSQVSSLADKAYMTDYGRKLFYLNDPQIQPKQEFYSNCKDHEAVVLGCYKPPIGIYLLEVTDKRLAGVEEVTAAHEMLHAAYDRLDYQQKVRINELVNQTYEQLDDQAIKDKIGLYLENGADTTNELHSILGTEVAKLPAELETYYNKYFTKRSAVVQMAADFQNVFTSRRLKVDELDKQLSNIEQQVKANNQKLSEMESAITEEAARLEALLREDKIEEYNQGVPAYNASLTPYRNLQATTRGLIEQYKTILSERNRIALEVQELNKPLDNNISTDSADL